MAKQDFFDRGRRSNLFEDNFYIDKISVVALFGVSQDLARMKLTSQFNDMIFDEVKLKW